MVQTVPRFEPGILSGREIIGSFDGGDISSDGGVILVAEAERKLGLIGRLALVIDDERDPVKVRHGISEMLAQRVFPAGGFGGARVKVRCVGLRLLGVGSDLCKFRPIRLLGESASARSHHVGRDHALECVRVGAGRDHEFRLR
ncbi:MAG: transposase [Armatimonadota bacterium]|jgi:hypothetical protein